MAEAARDSELKEGEAGLSVFRVEGEADSREVALRFAITRRAEPQHADWVVFPSEPATRLGLIVEPVASPGLDPYLRGRHHEILGLTPALGLRLAEAILAHGERQVDRIRERELIALAGELYRRNPELGSYPEGPWPERLAAYGVGTD